MTWGNANGDGSGYYNIGGRLIYFEKNPTKEEIQQKLTEIKDAPSAYCCTDCGGACCEDQPRIIH